MWDLSEGSFRMPHVPLFSWEELGKMDPAILRTLRHLYFANYTPSADGAMYLSDPGIFDMEKAELSVKQNKMVRDSLQNEKTEVRLANAELLSKYKAKAREL